MSEEAGGQHFRFDTEHGPLHLWRPANYDQDKAGMVIYIHGYFTSVDQAWTDDHLARQFAASRRNALFVAIHAPQSNEQEVVWKSLPVLLQTVESLTNDPLPPGPLVVIGHSGGFRTILLWLDDPRVQYVDLLDGLYGGVAEFRYWLRPHPRAKAHRMVVVANGTWRQSNRLARHTSGAVRRRGMPANASTFTTLQRKARLLCIRSQYSHDEIVSSGKVIPVLLQISALGAVPAAPRTEKIGSSPLAPLSQSSPKPADTR